MKDFIFRPETVQKLIRRDVGLIRREARIVFELRKDGSVIKYTNPTSRLNVMAIIGEGINPRYEWVKPSPEALLCEIGLSRGRPFREAHVPRIGESQNVPSRRNYFDLSEGQYLIIAPTIMRTIHRLARERVSQWKSGGTFCLPTPNFYYKRGRKQFLESVSYCDQPKGARFSIPLSSHHLIADIYWAEIFGNKQIQHRLRSLARFVDLCLSGYPTNGHSLNQFLRLKGVRPIERVLSSNSLPPYLKVGILRFLPGGMGHRHIDNLARVINWNLEETEEERLAKSVLKNPKQRLSDLQVRITSKKDTSGYLCFEVYPNLDSSNSKKIKSALVPESIPSVSDVDFELPF